MVEEFAAPALAAKPISEIVASASMTTPATQDHGVALGTDEEPVEKRIARVIGNAVPDRAACNCGQ